MVGNQTNREYIYASTVNNWMRNFQALMLYGNEAILLSNDEENDETQLCKSVRSTGVDPLDFRITRCWPVIFYS